MSSLQPNPFPQCIHKWFSWCLNRGSQIKWQLQVIWVRDIMWADGWPFSVLFPRNTYSGLSKSDNDTQLLQSIFPQNLHLVRKKMFFRLRQLTILSYKHELWDLALVAKTPQLLCGVCFAVVITDFYFNFFMKSLNSANHSIFRQNTL